MKILFVENRYKTYFYEPIAKHLQQLGHDIFWLIQNKKFKPKQNFQFKFIKYPKSANLQDYSPCNKIEDIIRSDRQQNFFLNTDTSYFYYYDQEIQEYLKEINPDIVFGESTAFHELITIKNCKDLGILFLNPSTCRYPIGRFSFYKYNTLEPYKGSGNVLSEKDATEVIDQIVNRKTPPDYMKPVMISKGTVAKDQLKKINSYVNGEIFNTPSPLVKYKIEKIRKQNIINWDASASVKVKEGSVFNVLYPLQMQPEANIDVWGRKHRNQTELIKSIASALPEHAILYVKPNPKSKYELSSELLEVVESQSNIRHLHHDTKMDDILPLMQLVITVTGTIAIESILTNKPVITLVKTINNTAKNCIYLDAIDERIKSVITTIENACFETLNLQGKIAFINAINQSSYKGIISDPYTDANCMSRKNINDLIQAFESIIN